MAIIILEGADFSANNIGRITLPKEIHQFTKNIFSHCTKYSINSEQASLVDAFIKYLDDEGLLDHLGLFMAPWLSENINEATYNIATDVQYQYDSGVSLVDGVLCSTDINNRVRFGNNTLPSVNFIATVSSGPAKIWNFTYTGTDSSHLTLFGCTVPSNSIIARTLNSSAGVGYRINVDSWPGAVVYLFNIKGLSDLDTNGTKINNYAVSPTSGYNKSSEPLTDNLASIIGTINQAGTRYKQIFIAGDGTVLTDEQSTSMLTALRTLQAGLAALEG